MNLPGPLGGTHKLAAWLNSLRSAIMEREVRPGLGYKVKQTVNGTVLEIRQAGASGASIERYVFKSQEADYIVCRTWDGTTEGDTDVRIAKPPKLRGSVASEVLDGDTYTYTYTTTGTNKHVLRTSVRLSDNNSEDQAIIPRFILDDEIYAMKADTGVTYNDGEDDFDVELIDLNLDARAWAAQ